jgi:hypothetical protein
VGLGVITRGSLSRKVRSRRCQTRSFDSWHSAVNGNVDAGQNRSTRAIGSLPPSRALCYGNATLHFYEVYTTSVGSTTWLR